MKNKKYIIIGVVFIGILFMGIGLYLNQEKPEIQTQKNIDFNINLADGKETKKTKKEAYEAEITDSINNQRKSKYNLGGFGMFSKDTIKSEEQSLDDKINEILKEEQITYEEHKRSSRAVNRTNYSPSRRSYDRETKRKAEQKTQLELLEEERQRFKNTFKKRDRTKNPTNNNQAVLKTDRVLFAEIDGDQTVTKDDRMKMILKKQATVNGIIIPKGTRFYGTVSFASHRIYINVTNINNVPVKLKVYDNEDGSIGVYSKRKLMTKAKDEAIDDQVNSVDSKGVKILDSARKIFKKNKVEKVYMLNKQPLLIK